MIVYLSRMTGKNADVSYNVYWLGLWVFAETSLVITVTGTFLLPKFVEAKGAKLRGVFMGLARSFPSSITSITSFAHVTQLKKNTINSQDGRLDTIAMIGRSESDVSTMNRDQDVERQTSDESVHHSAWYSDVSDPVNPDSSSWSYDLEQLQYYRLVQCRRRLHVAYSTRDLDIRSFFSEFIDKTWNLFVGCR